jgi:uncharacterized UPF0160 family protein
MSLERIKEKLNRYLKMLPVQVAIRVANYIKEHGLIPQDALERSFVLERLASAYGDAATTLAFKKVIPSELEGVIISEALAIRDLYIPEEEELQDDARYLEALEELLDVLMEHIRKHRRYVEWVREQWKAIKEILSMLSEA